MKPTVSLTLIAALLLGLLLYLRAGNDGSSTSAVEPGAPLSTPAGAGVGEGRPSIELGVSQREGVGALQPPAEPAPTDVIGARVQLLGRIVVTDAAGDEFRFEDGSGQVLVWLGDTGSYVDVDVVGGTFEVPVPAAARLAPLGFRLGGRTTVVEGVRLHVVSAATEEELDEVFPFQAPLRSPGSRAQQRTAAAPSPLEVERLRPGPGYRKTLVHARAPGHAWGSRVVDHDRGGDFQLALAPSCALDVHLVGDARGAHLRLRELPASGPVLVERELTDEVWVGFDSLAPATYVVRVELGAGQRPAVTLELAERPEVTLVLLAGTLELPKEWGLEPRALSLSFLGEPLAGQRKTQMLGLAPAPDTPELFRWEAGEVQPGGYSASVMGLLHQMEFEVGPGGSLDQRLVVPPPARVLLDVVDASSSQPLGLQQIQWNVGAGPSGSTTEKLAEADPETGRFEFFVAPGGVFVMPFGGGFQAEPKRFVAQAGTNTWTLELERGPSFRVVLRVAGQVVPPGGLAALTQAQRLDAPGTSSGTTLSRDGLEFSVPAPGRYVVQLPPPAGYLPPAPLEVVVKAGSFEEHVVELTRVL